MADNDKVFEILIKYGLQDDAAKEAAAQLGKLKENTNEAGKESEKLTIKHGDLHKMLRILGGSLGEFGHLIHYAFNPWLLATVAVSAAVKTLIELNKKLEDSINSVSTTVGNMRQAWEEVEIEAIKADKIFEEKQAGWKRDTETRISLIHSEKEAIKERMKTLEEEELAKAKTENEKSAIKKRYEGAGKQLETNAQVAELDAKESELTQLNLARLNRLDEANKLGGGQSPKEIAVRLKAVADAKAALEEQGKAAKEGTKELQPTAFQNLLYGMANFFPGAMGTQMFYAQSGAAQSQASLGEAMVRAGKASFPAEERLTRAATAFEAAAKLEEEIKNKEAENYRTRAGIQIRTAITGEGPQMFNAPHLTTGGGDIGRQAEGFARRDFDQLFYANQNPGALNPNQAGMIAQLLSVALGHQVKVNEVGKGLAEYFASQRQINDGYDRLLRAIQNELAAHSSRIQKVGN